MKFWSIRTVDELDVLLSGRPLRTDPNKVDEHRQEAYQWMSKQLRKKVKPPKGVEYPIWLWRYWEGAKRPMPDLRAGGHIKKATQGVRITLDIPSDKVLLSNFDGWHAVLNNHHFCETDEDYDAFVEYEHQETNKALVSVKKEESWLGILLTEHLPDDWAVQAVTWEILPEYVVDYKIFTGR